MNDNISILKNYLLYFLTFILICFIGISGVFADTIDTYSTKYYYYFANNNSSTSSTTYRSGESNKVTLDGATAPTYANGEGFNGFDNQISYSITKGSIYTLSLTVSYNGLLDSEFSRDTINNRLFNTNFVHCSDCTVTAISGTIRRFSSTNQGVSGLYDFDVRVNYTILATSNASTWYLGSYTGDDRTLGLDNHLYTSIVNVHTLNISNDNNSTIINQNQTIIDQNNQIISGNNQNTQDIINNNNTNTDNIINNQNQNTQEQIESQKVCTDKSILYSDTIATGALSSAGTPNPGYTSFGVTDYIDITNVDSLSFTNTYISSGIYYCFYDSSKSLISCFNYVSENFNPTILDNYHYARFTIRNTNQPTVVLKTCQNGNQALNDNISGLNDSLNNSDVDNSDALDFFNNFSDNTHGLSGIISAPLNAINSMLNNQCSPLTATWKGKTVSLDCGYNFWSRLTGFKEFLNIALDGLLCYRILLKMFKLVEKLKNPEDDRVEVMDL